jgi:hypothetical protein
MMGTGSTPAPAETVRSVTALSTLLFASNGIVLVVFDFLFGFGTSPGIFMGWAAYLVTAEEIHWRINVAWPCNLTKFLAGDFGDLPVHRMGGRRAPVIAFAKELDALEHEAPRRLLDEIVDLKSQVASLRAELWSLKRALRTAKRSRRPL